MNCEVKGWKGGEKWLRNWFLVKKTWLLRKFKVGYFSSGTVHRRVRLPSRCRALFIVAEWCPRKVVGCRAQPSSVRAMPEQDGSRPAFVRVVAELAFHRAGGVHEDLGRCRAVSEECPGKLGHCRGSITSSTWCASVCPGCTGSVRGDRGAVRGDRDAVRGVRGVIGNCRSGAGRGARIWAPGSRPGRSLGLALVGFAGGLGSGIGLDYPISFLFNLINSN